MIQAFTETLGWDPIHKKCGPVRGRNSLDAELGGCGMLMDNLNQWINDEHLSLPNCIFRRGALYVGPPTPSCGVRVACSSGVRGFVEKGVRGK